VHGQHARFIGWPQEPQADQAGDDFCPWIEFADIGFGQ
jgi:hypothetical protein